MARPSKYTKKLAVKFCYIISTSSLGIKRICEKYKDMPTEKTIHNWLNSDKEFLQLYTRAKEFQADFMIDETIDIADDGTNDTIIIQMPSGAEREVENKEWTNRSKLRIETRKWIASKLKPKKYGDKLDVTSDGEKIVTPPVLNIQIDGEKIKLE